MSSGGYRGGSTIIRPGSDWFGGRKRNKTRDLGKGELTPRSGPKTELEKEVAERLIANRKAETKGRQVVEQLNRQGLKAERKRLAEERRQDRAAKAQVSARRRKRHAALAKEGQTPRLTQGELADQYGALAEKKKSRAGAAARKRPLRPTRIVDVVGKDPRSRTVKEAEVKRRLTEAPLTASREDATAPGSPEGSSPPDRRR